jgi:predicted DCC family thiol-disulfide oxidoreductase YuxK
VHAQAYPEPNPPPPAVARRWALLWDGDCGFCRRVVQRVLRADRAGCVAAIPYEGALAWLPAEVRARSSRQAHLRSPDGRYWGGGDAVIALLGVLGHPALARLLGAPGLRTLVRLAYRVAARHRGSLARWL